MIPKRQAGNLIRMREIKAHDHVMPHPNDAPAAVYPLAGWFPPGESKPLRKARFWDIRRASVVAKTGGDTSGVFVSSTLLISLAGLFLTVLIVIGGAGWALAVNMTVLQQEVIKLKLDRDDMRAYISQLRDEQIRAKTEKETAERLSQQKKGK